MADALFALSRLAAVYDPLDPDRGDLDVYAAIVEELGANDVIDLGCGTGTLACLLAQRGKYVIGIDPAEASLDVARREPRAERVRWVRGDWRALAGLRVDMVTMTGNVAQVLIADEEWTATLQACHAALRPGGWLVFETRVPARQAWREWTRGETYREVDIPGVGTVETWVELTDVRLPLVSFRTTFAFASDGSTLTSDSTLRFRDRPEVEASLNAAGFSVGDVRDALDRPGREMVFVARVASTSAHNPGLLTYGDKVVETQGEIHQLIARMWDA